MRIPLFDWLLLCWASSLAAQENYAAAKIPSTLRENAHVVIRRHLLNFEVLDRGEAVETEQKVLTLLDEQAAAQNEQVFFYSKLEEIDDLEGVIYDGKGNPVRRIKKKDILDQKVFEQKFVDDSRYKLIQFPRLNFPYTIEYTITRRYHGLLFYPVFEPQRDPAQSVEYARFELKMPEGLSARFSEKDVPPACKTGPLRWEFHKLPAFEPEPFAPDFALGLPRIMTGPKAFRMGGYDGDMSSWQSLGKFLQQLNAGQQDLPAETVAALRKLTGDCPDAACKIERIYALLQSTTRYFFVGLGIGGWQPMSAEAVDDYKYGDCKGLSNYTVALLRAVGVPAFYALIRATPEEQKAQAPDFPNAWFNHAIVCVPLSQDTLWLECTSQTESCGFLSDFTDDRPALVVFPDSGRLLQTPRYDETVNSIRRQTALSLAADGSATLTTSDVYRGIAQSVPAALAELPDERRAKYLYERMRLSDFTIRSLTFERKKARLPEVTQHLALDVPSLAAVSGKRLFLPAGFLASKVVLPAPLSGERRFPVQAHSRGLTEEDSIVVRIPEGYVLENALAPITYHSGFGHFEWSAQMENGLLLLHRKLVLYASVQPAAQYGELLAFLGNVARADNQKLVLVH